MSFKDDIRKSLGNIDVTLAEQHVTLKDHIRRTELLETAIEPLKSHAQRINGGIKLIGLCAAIAAIVESLHWVMK